MSGFDPYHEWLGIPPAEQPPTLYRLLGLSPFESSQQAIVNASDRQLAHVRRFAAGPRGEYAHPLLNEIARALCVLCDPTQKASYDASLSARFTTQPPPVPPPLAPEKTAPPAMLPSETPYVPRRRRRTAHQESNPAGFAAMAVFGGIAGICIALCILWFGFGMDPLGVFQVIGGLD